MFVAKTVIAGPGPLELPGGARAGTIVVVLVDVRFVTTTPSVPDGKSLRT